MKYVIFSDLHSNLEALQAFQNEIQNLQYDRLVFLGDSVGYGPDPDVVLDWLRENVDLFLSGNHDHAVVGKISTLNFNPYSYQSTMWTRKRIGEKNKHFLEECPIKLSQDGILWVHSSPFQPEKWHYLTSVEDGPKNFSAFTESLCFIGHNHHAFVMSLDAEGEVSMTRDTQVQIEPDRRYIISVGSLGQPRDGDPKPSFVVFDSIDKVVRTHRLSYDIKLTQEKIEQSDLPPFFGERLEYGR